MNYYTILSSNHHMELLGRKTHTIFDYSVKEFINKHYIMLEHIENDRFAYTYILVLMNNYEWTLQLKARLGQKLVELCK